MREITEFIRAYDAYIILVILALGLILLINNVYLSRRLHRVVKRQNAKLDKARAGDIVDCLEEQSRSLSDIRSHVVSLDSENGRQNEALLRTISYVGIVRYDAFEDVGGEQSFSAALLDSNKDGIVISSLYGRHDSRLYAKAVSGGKGERELSEEEMRAVDEAVAGSSKTRPVEKV